MKSSRHFDLLFCFIVVNATLQILTLTRYEKSGTSDCIELILYPRISGLSFFYFIFVATDITYDKLSVIQSILDHGHPKAQGILSVAGTYVVGYLALSKVWTHRQRRHRRPL